MTIKYETPIIHIELNDRKYTVIQTKTQFKALRYGEEWRDLTGDKLVLALACEVHDLREQLASIARNGT